MKKISKRKLLANTFGTLGYFSCIFLWGWVGVLYVPMILDNEIVVKTLIPTPSEEAVRYTPPEQASPFITFGALFIAVIILIITIITFLKAPATIARTGKSVTTKVAVSAVPLVVRHQKIPPKKKKILTARIIQLIKLLIVALPFALVAVGAFITLPLPYETAMIIVAVLSITTLTAFGLQYTLAKLLGVDLEELV